MMHTKIRVPKFRLFFSEYLAGFYCRKVHPQILQMFGHIVHGSLRAQDR